MRGARGEDVLRLGTSSPEQQSRLDKMANPGGLQKRAKKA